MTELENIKARQNKPEIAVIERWNKVTGAHEVFSPDLEQMSTDIARLIQALECAIKQRDQALFMAPTDYDTAKQSCNYHIAKILAQGADRHEAK